MSQSPKKPWKKGKQPEYTAFQLVVNVCQDADGNVWSDHEFLSSKDEALAASLPQGGAPQVAHALLTEAVRREAFMCALLELTKEPGLLRRWIQGDVEVEGHLGSYTSHVITKTLEKMIPGSVAGILEMMVSQGSGIVDSE